MNWQQKNPRDGGVDESAPRSTGAASGLGAVTGAIAAAGVLTYAFQVAVARVVPSAADFASFGVFWSLALVIAFGAFSPVESELARSMHRSPADSPLPRYAVRTTAILTGACMLGLLLAAPWLAPLAGGTGPVIALLAVCVVSAGQFVLRGLLLASGRLTVHAVVLVVDALGRVLLVLAVAWVSVAGPTGVAWAFVAASACAHLPLLVAVVRPRLAAGRRGRRTADAVNPTGNFPAAVRHLLVGSVCAQALLNLPPILVTALAAPGQEQMAASFVASFLLIRLPLFVAVPLQSALIPVLISSDHHRPGGMLGRRGVRPALIGAMGTVCVITAASVAVGPWALGLIYGSRFSISGADFAVLTGGSLVHLALLLVTQTLIAGGRHRAVALTWGSGLVVGALVAALVPDLLLRAALGFAAGSVVAFAVGSTLLLRRRLA